eukprot:TRINITY_DN49047_c0_g1_i2.p1 TRINITY_DN49047_c0_g1~~TRINITY_DN49047_c0_g1_i2.p1  ORF type:complete len:356 (+),score=47.37 TRINITY_DN49047_c0_g1_i2:29-1069(+)
MTDKPAFFAENEARFSDYCATLDAQNDKRERVMRASRDATTFAKRAIFTLLRAKTDEDFDQALDQFQDVRDCLKAIYDETVDVNDYWKYVKVWTHGVQEYIEGVALYHYLKTGEIISKEQLQADYFQLRDVPPEAEAKRAEAGRGRGRGGRGGRGGPRKRQNDNHPQVATATETTPPATETQTQQPTTAQQEQKPTPQQNTNENSTTTTPQETTSSSTTTQQDTSKASPLYGFVVPDLDYLMGIADTSGELMRLATNAMTEGNYDVQPKIKAVLTQLQNGLFKIQSVMPQGPLNGKMGELKRSIEKLEKLCYHVQVVGGEYAQMGVKLKDVVGQSEPETREREETD